MIEIIFRSEAEADLRSIVDHYEQVAAASVDAILADIHRSISQLAYFPRLGMAVPERVFRAHRHAPL